MQPIDAQPSASTADPRQVARRMSAAFLPYSLGYYGVVPFLALGTQARFHSALAVGVAVVTFTVADGAGGLAAAPLLHRVTFGWGMSAAMLFSSAAFWLLTVRLNLACFVLALGLAALGGSIFALLGRAYVAERLHDGAQRHVVFTWVQVVVNVAAAAGPGLIGLLSANGADRRIFAVVGILYLTSAVVARFASGIRGKPRPVSSRWPISRQFLRAVLSEREAVRVFGLVMVGSLVYRQFYSAFALDVAADTRTAELVPLLFVINALAVALLQLPVSWLVRRRTGEAFRASRIMGLGLCVFAVALIGMCLLPLGGVVVALLVVVVFSVAETIYTPTASVGVADVDVGSALEAFNLRQIVWTAGSVLGGFAGGTLFILARGAAAAGLYWLLLSVLVFLIGVVRFSTRSQ